jgi:hypothetical protein
MTDYDLFQAVVNNDIVAVRKLENCNPTFKFNYGVFTQEMTAIDLALTRLNEIPGNNKILNSLLKSPHVDYRNIKLTEKQLSGLNPDFGFRGKLYNLCLLALNNASKMPAGLKHDLTNYSNIIHNPVHADKIVIQIMTVAFLRRLDYPCYHYYKDIIVYKLWEIGRFCHLLPFVSDINNYILKFFIESLSKKQ